MATTVLALGCHPDDIEFLMAGTLFLLKDAGCTLHYMNLANGSCGTTRHSAEEITAIRRNEAIQAAQFLGAEYHESCANDLEVFYEQPLIRKATYVIRKVKPDILLLLSPQDYMEDHMNTARIGITAAFCRGIKNYMSDPPHPAAMDDMYLYHAMPVGLTDWVREPIQPHIYIDVGSSIDRKETMLAYHVSQKTWLDESQGMDSFLISMRELSGEAGQQSDRYEYAEGWRRHTQPGFSRQDLDPLSEILSAYSFKPT